MKVKLSAQKHSLNLGVKKVHEIESERVTEKKHTVTLGTLLNMYFEYHDL